MENKNLAPHEPVVREGGPTPSNATAEPSAAFTPGPWLWQHSGDGDGNYVVWTRQPHTGELATVNCEDINGEFPAKANARLIAAAPELLAVAQRYEAWEANLVLHGRWEATGDGLPTLTEDLYDEMMELQALRNAAIAKATGAGE